MPRNLVCVFIANRWSPRHDAGEARNGSSGLFAGLEGPYALLRKGRSQLPVPKAHKPFAAESARGEELEHLAHYEYLASNV
jgi:hypothetical protein